MLRKLLSIPTALLAATAVLVSVSARASDDSPPNIIYILVDDLGKEWVSCYGGDLVKTPNIDRLAESGAIFTNVYSMPQCTPSRAAFLTGQYPWRNGWINHWDVPRWGAGCHFDPGAYTSFAKVLKSAGYQTCIAGKWQINDFRVQPRVLVEHGFDEYCMWTGYETGVPASAERYWDPYIHTKSGSKTYPGQFGDDIFTDFIISFLREHKDSPMMVYYPMCLTHGPLTTTPAEPDASGKIGQHQAMVRYTDHLVGKIVAELESLGIRDNTLLIWTTDNGTSGGIKGKRLGKEVKGGKGKTLETGVNAPFVASWPGRIKPGTTTDALVDFTDFYPTFLDLAGAGAPTGHAVDGKSFAALLRGESGDSSREWILAMGGHSGTIDPGSGRVANVFSFRDRVIRDKRYKLLVGTDRKPAKLFDLQQDPTEKSNILKSGIPGADAAQKRLWKVIESLPKRDANPQYDPLPAQPWDRKPKTPKRF